MSVTKYLELHPISFGLVVPIVEILVTRDPNQLLHSKHQTNLLGVMGWNLVHLAFKKLTKFCKVKAFESFYCPNSVNPLLFLQLHFYYHTDVCIIQTSVTYTAHRSIYGQDLPSKTPNFFPKIKRA